MKQEQVTKVKRKAKPIEPALVYAPPPNLDDVDELLDRIDELVNKD